MHLLFIEGVSGVGKTTMTKSLSYKLREAGFSADCYLEFDIKPIDFYCVAYFKQDEYLDLLAKYSQFAEDITSNTISVADVRLVRYYIGENALFSAPLIDLLHEREFCWQPQNPVPFSEYTRVNRLVWEHFAKANDGKTDYLLFDGSLFHHPINDMIRNYAASHKQCSEQINSLLKPLKNFFLTLSICR
jgi:hypothetical protein